MPRIDTSSDMYQNRDVSLTTYKKDIDPTVAYKDLPQSDDRARVRDVQSDLTKLQNQIAARDQLQRDVREKNERRPVEVRLPDSLYPPLYDPRNASSDRPLDASSFVTGGTVDVRA